MADDACSTAGVEHPLNLNAAVSRTESDPQEDPVQSVRGESVQWFAQYKRHKGLPSVTDIQDRHVADAVLAWEKALLSSIVQLRCVDRVGSFLDGVPEALQHTVQDDDRQALLAWHRDGLAALQKDLHMYTSCLTGYMATVQNVETLVQKRLAMLDAMDRHTAFSRVVPQLAEDFAKRTALMAVQATENKTTTLRVARDRLLRYAPSAPDSAHAKRGRRRRRRSRTPSRSRGGTPVSAAARSPSAASRYSSHGVSDDSVEERRVHPARHAPKRAQERAEGRTRRPPTAERAGAGDAPVARPRPTVVMVSDETTVSSRGAAVQRPVHTAVLPATDLSRHDALRPVVDGHVTLASGAHAPYTAFSAEDIAYLAEGNTASTARGTVDTRSTVPTANAAAAPWNAASDNGTYTSAHAPAASGAGGDAVPESIPEITGSERDESERSSRGSSGSDFSQSSASYEYDSSVSDGASHDDGSTDAYASDDSMDTRTEDAVQRVYSDDAGAGDGAVQPVTYDAASVAPPTSPPPAQDAATSHVEPLQSFVALQAAGSQ